MLTRPVDPPPPGRWTIDLGRRSSDSNAHPSASTPPQDVGFGQDIPAAGREDAARHDLVFVEETAVTARHRSPIAGVGVALGSGVGAGLGIIVAVVVGLDIAYGLIAGAALGIVFGLLGGAAAASSMCVPAAGGHDPANDS
jgi:hypothetical protein